MRMRVAALAVLAGMALALPAAPAVAAACSQGSGVTVVVDFASLGGGQQVRCTDTDPASGIEALRQAGFTPTRAAQVPGYFLCRIDGKPANDPCQRTSPAEAYWSYWHAKPGGAWAYSSRGAGDYDPPPGSVEGWAFGAGEPPASPPPRTAARPASSPTASPAASPAAAAAPQPSPSPTSARAARTSTMTPSPSDSPVTAAPLASQAPSTDPTPVTSSTTAFSPPAGDNPTPARTSGASGALLAAGLVALLLAAGATTFLRRRRDERA